MSQGQGVPGPNGGPAAPTGVPYLGSKISLISKAEIRYEGTLYTIDPIEATVALAKVRSFGTEDRPTDRPLPARNEIFEFIIFRGHDIKDLHVCEPPKPQPTEGVPLDPAIVKSSQPPPGPAGAAFSSTTTTFPPGQMYQPFGQPMYFGQNQQAPGFTMPPSQTHHHQAGSTRESSPGVDSTTVQTNRTAPIGTRPVAGSQSSTPPLSRKSPTADQGVQAQPGSPEKSSNEGQHINRSQHQQYRGQPVRRGSGGGQRMDNNRDRGERGPSGSYTRGRSNNRDLSGQARGPSRGGPRGATRGHPRGGRSNEPLKFDTEFDFETSNAQFLKDDIEKELKNLSLSDKSVNGDKGEEEPEVEEDEGEEEEEEPVFYDQKKSFFDNISCESTERNKGQRHSWREERKLNSETFGISENFRRNYRGRHNWRGGNVRGAWRGGRGRGGGGGFNRDGGSYSREGGSYSREGGSYNRDGGSFNREGSGYRNRDGGYYVGNTRGSAGSQGRRNWDYDDRRRNDGPQRVEVKS
ncbi:protein LSM14 homolog A-like isoform X1 [Biomphalaria glabrata]|uniref:Protein LSM14 homolog A-like isoform X1 n=1 Tax=Biomphalaria glabrata TaxID=6526 RepID=A0A9U8ENZ8_BIOGL|nr:protein LSM14 homolog A-like isoform X1 [Biomphalaria glabrata]